MGSLREKVREIEREEIINALKECNWVMAKAAKEVHNRTDDRVQDKKI